MTVTDESVDVTEGGSGDLDATVQGSENDSDSGTKKREQDFTKHRDFHEELASFINSHPKYVEANLGDLSPGQVKAVLTLRGDYANTPERIALRAEAKAKAAEEAKQYEGLTPEQVKARKAAARVDAQVAKFEAKAKEARERAEKLRNEASASGEDLAAVVASQQESVPEPEDETPTKRFGRRK